jgi:hypothetical protein
MRLVAMEVVLAPLHFLGSAGFTTLALQAVQTPIGMAGGSCLSD